MSEPLRAPRLVRRPTRQLSSSNGSLGSLSSQGSFGLTGLFGSSGSFSGLPQSGSFTGGPPPTGLGTLAPAHTPASSSQDNDLGPRAGPAKRGRAAPSSEDDSDEEGRESQSKRADRKPDRPTATPSALAAVLGEEDDDEPVRHDKRKGGSSSALVDDEEDEANVLLKKKTTGAAKRPKRIILSDDEDEDEKPSAATKAPVPVTPMLAQGPSAPSAPVQALVPPTPVMARAPSFDYGPSRPTTSINLPQVPDEAWIGKKPPRGTKDNRPTFTQAMTSRAEASGLDIESKPNRGMIISDEDLLADQPADLDFRGFRARQVLHQHSEVLKWHLKQHINPVATAEEQAKYQKAVATYPKRKAAYDKALKAFQKGKRAKEPRAVKEPEDPGDQYYSPVEVQSEYVTRNGVTRLAVSANEHASQVFLSRMTRDDIRKMYAAAAALPGGSQERDRVRRAAIKILESESLDKRRRDADAKAKPGDAREKEPDLRRAATLADFARSGRYSVVLNPGGRHAEQNLKEAYKANVAAAKARGEDTSGDERDVAGTYIRCGACSTQLGPDEVYNHIHKQSTGKDHPHLTGTFYGHEMEPNLFSAAAAEYVDDAPRGRTRTRAMTTGAAERARSRSKTPPRSRPAPPLANPLAAINSAPSAPPPSGLPATAPAPVTAPTTKASAKAVSGTIDAYYKKAPVRPPTAPPKKPAAAAAAAINLVDDDEDDW